MADNNTQMQIGMAFMVGIVAGYVTSLLIPEKTQEKAREQFSESARQISNGITSMEGIQQVKSSFMGIGGQAKDNMMDVYLQSREKVMKQLQDLKEPWEQLDSRKYKKLVKDTLAEMVNNGEVPSDHLKTLQGYLESDFQTFRSA